jgi:DNA polymerase III psi subunit
MNYIVTKQTPRNEWRIYLDEEITDQDVIYKGHKLAIETKHLVEFLEFRMEKSSGKVFFLNYEKLKEQPDTKDMNMWITGTESTLERIVEQSWSSLQKKLKEKKTNFRKITVTRVNV